MTREVLRRSGICREEAILSRRTLHRRPGGEAIMTKYPQEYLDEFAFRQSNRVNRDALVGLVHENC